ncbi:hypothetical protein [Streptacidiphilus cavernicola]|uniref:DUF4190 domain-containing protein n=1 Tax=Streptacidiphilus cavernicola TaxID=3342716 RepID=A0ABV6VTI5_9ACTN
MVQKSDSGTPPEGPRDPFAPPPKDAPDRPWQPRQPRQHPNHPGERGWANEDPPRGGGEDGSGGQDGGSGSGPSGSGPAGNGGQRPVVPPPHPWSPGYQGAPPRLGYGPQPQGPRFDPTDPVQRRARYALLSGMWGIFFLILGLPYVTLALASLALYWSISSLRGTAKTPVSALTAGASGPAAGTVGPAGPPPPPGYGHGGYLAPPPPYATKPQLPAALGGLVASIVGLSLVAAVFGVQLYYKNYYDCQANALTRSVYQQCANQVTPKPPEWLKQLNGDT